MGNDIKAIKKTFREAISELLKTVYDPYVGIDIYAAYRRKHGITNIDTRDFFRKGGEFDSFLDKELEVDVFQDGVEHFKSKSKKAREGELLIEEGEDLIRKGYKMIDESSHLASRSLNGKDSRTHIVHLDEAEDS